MTRNQLRPAAAAFLLMLTMSLLSTGLSFFVGPVCEELGFGRGTFSWYYSLMVGAGAVSVSVLGGYMNKHGVKMVALVSGIWCCACLWGFSLSTSLWMFYIAGGLMGLFGTSCVYLCANLIVQKSYSSEGASAVLGVVMAGAGVGGVLWSNVTPWAVEALGWRMGYRVLGICWLALTVLSVLVLGKEKQEEFVTHTGSNSQNNSKKAIFRSGKFYMAVVVMCALSVASCIS